MLPWDRMVRTVLILALAACGTARVIQRTRTGGVIELQGDHGKAMEQAIQQMAAQCGPNNFMIMQEADEPIGAPTATADNDDITARDNPQAARTALRVHYQCTDTSAPPPSGPST